MFHWRVARRHASAAALLGAVLVVARPGGAQVEGNSRAPTHMAPIRIPESMRLEHEEIHDELVRVSRLSGRVGTAARELAAILHTHFVREEQIALPPLGLLAPLSRGEVTPAMYAVLAMTDSLRAELPRMLAEHNAIRTATIRPGEVAQAEGNDSAARLAEQLKLHAESEEELFYPAAVLVGDLVRARTLRERKARER